MLEQSLRKLFEQQAEAEPPPGRITVASVLRQGRLRRRRHRIGAAGAPVLAAVAVAAIALTGALPLGNLGRTNPQSGGYGRLVGGAFDPSYLAIAFGWLPKGTVVTNGGITPGMESLSTYGPHGQVWALAVHAPNACHLSPAERRLDCVNNEYGLMPFLGSKLSITGRGPAIAGHKSVWVDGGANLVWQYAPNAWAELQHVSSLSGKATAARIATGVKYDQHVPLSFAARFTSLPRDWQIIAVQFGPYDRVGSPPRVAREPRTYEAWDYLMARLPTISPTTSLDAPDEPDILIQPTAPGGQCFRHPGTRLKHVTIHGYQYTLTYHPFTRHGAWRAFQEYLCGSDADGLSIGLEETGAGAHMGFPVTQIMERLQLLGNRSSDWVTNPLP
jgi:hypothetical protein